MSLPTPYYQDDSCTIYHADCRDILPHLPKVDLVLTDPPYGVDLGAKLNNGRDRFAYGVYNDNEENIEIILYAIDKAISLAERTVITPGTRNLFKYPNPDHIGSFYYPAAAGCNAWGFSCWQPILYYGKDPYGGKGSRPDSYASTEASEKNGHPCPKPIGQWSWLMNRCSLDGETILDPFMGSGTTLVAAQHLGRKAIGIEIEKRYCDIAIRRLAQQSLPLTEPLNGSKIDHQEELYGTSTNGRNETENISGQYRQENDRRTAEKTK